MTYLSVWFTVFSDMRLFTVLTYSDLSDFLYAATLGCHT